MKALLVTIFCFSFVYSVSLDSLSYPYRFNRSVTPQEFYFFQSKQQKFTITNHVGDTASFQGYARCQSISNPRSLTWFTIGQYDQCAYLYIPSGSGKIWIYKTDERTLYGDSIIIDRDTIFIVLRKSLDLPFQTKLVFKVDGVLDFRNTAMTFKAGQSSTFNINNLTSETWFFTKSVTSPVRSHSKKYFAQAPRSYCTYLLNGRKVDDSKMAAIRIRIKNQLFKR
jgi:hypothetical protein